MHVFARPIILVELLMTYRAQHQRFDQCADLLSGLQSFDARRQRG